MKKTPRSIPTKRRFPTLFIIVVLCIGAIILLLLKNSYFDNKKTTPNDNGSEAITSTTSSRPALQSQPLTPDPPVSSPAEPLPQPTHAKTESSLENIPCQNISTNLQAFFKYLEEQKYVKAYTRDVPVDIEIIRIINSILNTPPQNSNETADLLSVIRNSSHLFRVLGRKDLSFLKDIITNEHTSLEQHFATLYAWSTRDSSCQNNSTIKLELPLIKTYEYAAFFLNTLGGQSYLSRRDTTVRTLAKYYCVLILDQAVSQSLNIYNINLDYHLDSIIDDLANSNSLEKQSQYLNTLQNIKSKLHNQRKL